MSTTAIQDYYPEQAAVCYGCGRNNPDGLQIKTYWDGTEGVCRYRPRPEHLAFPGAVYGGLTAALIDCHSVATAAAALAEQNGVKLGEDPLPLLVTGTLNVRFVSPLPVGVEVELQARVEEIKGRKVTVSCSVVADGQERAKGEVVAIQMGG
ncbi:MAG: PaaI family thioesterase [Deltaproteobacteria bacterium]|nr:PaaI family thioesterase [Deltaproteobacteria bacterium]MBW2534487.1 PaaI family thioesterase [Deltaproteobacteria bacterium]